MYDLELGVVENRLGHIYCCTQTVKQTTLSSSIKDNQPELTLY